MLQMREQSLREVPAPALQRGKSKKISFLRESKLQNIEMLKIPPKLLPEDYYFKLERRKTPNWSILCFDSGGRILNCNERLNTWVFS